MKWSYFSLLMLFTLLMASLVPTARLVNYGGLGVGGVSYYHQRMADAVWESGFIEKDPLTEQSYQLNIYHVLLALAEQTLPYALLVLPVLVAFFCSLFLYGIGKKFSLSDTHRIVLQLVFIASPGFMYISSTATFYGLTILLLFIGMYCSLIRRGYGFAFVSFTLLSSFGLIESTLSLIVLLALARYDESHYVRYYSFMVPIVIMMIAFPHIQVEPLGTGMSLGAFVSDFGGRTGVGIFHVLLAMIGILFSWIQKREFLLVYVLTGFIVIGFGQYHSLSLYLYPIIAYFSSVGIVKFMRMKWTVAIIRDLTLLIIICALGFSTLSLANDLAHSAPWGSDVMAMQWIEEHTFPSERILSGNERSFWLQYFAKRKTYSDPFHPQDASVNEIFYGRELAKTVTLINSGDIDYIYVDPAMKEGEVWDKREGLLFLLQSRENFKKILEFDGREVWSVRKQ